MGTENTLDGDIELDPPLTWKEIKESPFYAPDHGASWWGRNIKLEVESETVDTDTGTATVITASRLVPTSDQPFKAHNLVAHLREFIKLYGKNRRFRGWIDCSPEDGGRWRAEIVDGEVVTTNAVTLWPEDLTNLRAALREAGEVGRDRTPHVPYDILRDALTVFLDGYDRTAGKPRT